MTLIYPLEAAVEAMDYAFRALAGITVFLLLVLFIMENKASKRDRLMQEKLDQIGEKLGLR